MLSVAVLRLTVLLAEYRPVGAGDEHGEGAGFDAEGAGPGGFEVAIDLGVGHWMAADGGDLDAAGPSVEDAAGAKVAAEEDGWGDAEGGEGAVAEEGDAVEEAIDGGGVGGHLGEAAVEAGVADDEEAGVDLDCGVIVELEGDAEAAVTEADLDAGDDVGEAAEAALEAGSDGGDGGGVEAVTGHEEDAAVAGATDVDGDAGGGELGAEGAEGVAGDARFFGPDVGGPAAHLADADAVGVEAVDEFVEGAVAAADDDGVAVTGGFEVLGEGGGVAGGFGFDDVGGEVMFVADGADGGVELAASGEAAGGGVDDEADPLGADQGRGRLAGLDERGRGAFLFECAGPL